MTFHFTGRTGLSSYDDYMDLTLEQSSNFTLITSNILYDLIIENSNIITEEINYLSNIIGIDDELGSKLIKLEPYGSNVFNILSNIGFIDDKNPLKLASNNSYVIRYGDLQPDIKNFAAESTSGWMFINLEQGKDLFIIENALYNFLKNFGITDDTLFVIINNTYPFPYDIIKFIWEGDFPLWSNESLNIYERFENDNIVDTVVQLKKIVAEIHIMVATNAFQTGVHPITTAKLIIKWLARAFKVVGSFGRKLLLKLAQKITIDIFTPSNSRFGYERISDYTEDVVEAIIDQLDTDQAVQTVKNTAFGAGIAKVQGETEALWFAVFGVALGSGLGIGFNFIGDWVSEAINLFSTDENGDVTEIRTFNEYLWFVFHRDPLNDTILESLTENQDLNGKIHNPSNAITKEAGRVFPFRYNYGIGETYIDILNENSEKRMEYFLLFETAFSLSLKITFKNITNYVGFLTIDSYLQIYYENGTLFFKIFLSDQTILVQQSHPYNFVLNQEYHIVFAHGKTSGLKIYIDKIEVLSGNYNLEITPPQWGIIPEIAYFYVLNLASECLIEDFRIIPIKVSIEDVALLYDAYAPIQTEIQKLESSLLQKIETERLTLFNNIYSESNILNNIIYSESNILNNIIYQESNILYDIIYYESNVLYNKIYSESNVLHNMISLETTIRFSEITNLYTHVNEINTAINEKTDGLWKNEGNMVYNINSNIAIGTTVSDGYKLNVSGTTKLNELYVSPNISIYAVDFDDFKVEFFVHSFWRVSETAIVNLIDNTQNTNFVRLYYDPSNKWVIEYQQENSLQLLNNGDTYTFTLGMNVKLENPNITALGFSYNLWDVYNNYSLLSTNRMYQLKAKTTLEGFKWIFNFELITGNSLLSGTYTYIRSCEWDWDKEHYIVWTLKNETPLSRTGYSRVFVDGALAVNFDPYITTPITGEAIVKEIWRGDTNNTFYYSDLLVIPDHYYNTDVKQQTIYNAIKTLNETPNTILYGKTYISDLIYGNLFQNGRLYITNNRTNFEASPEDGKITIAEEDTRRNFFVDTVKVNGTNNLINETGNAGYLYYSDVNSTTTAQVKSISYSELIDPPTSFPPSSHEHAISDITDLQTTLDGIDERFSSKVSSQWITSESDIYYNGNNVGIGVDNPQHKVDIWGETSFDGNVSLRLYNQASYYGRTRLYMIGRFENNNDTWNLNGGRNIIIFGSQPALNGAITYNNSIQSYNGGLGFFSKNYSTTSPALTILADGNVGIGNVNPEYKIDISGDINYTGTLRKSGTDVLQYLDATSSIQEQIDGKVSSQWTTTDEDIYYKRVHIYDDEIKVFNTYTKFPRQPFTLADSGKVKQSTNFDIVLYPDYLAFNYDITDNVGQHCVGGYDTGLARTTSSYSFTGYNGDYIMVNIGERFVLNKVAFYPRIDLNERCPGVFRIYGTNDINLFNTPSFSSGWTLIHDQTTKLTGYAYQQPTEVPFENYEPFSIYILVVNQLSGSHDVLNFVEWELYGYAEDTLVTNASILDTKNILQAQIDDKASLTHTHTISQITDRFSLFNNMGNIHTLYTDFNTPPDCGFWFIAGTTNGPATNGADQYYCINQGLGSPHPWTSYGMQIGIPRNVGLPYISIRFKNTTFGDWQKISAGQADKLTTARTINGVSFDGTANITIPTATSQWTTSGNDIYYNGGNVGIGTANRPANLSISGASATPRIILSGEEFYNAGTTSTDGIAFLTGVNRTDNRQLWIGDSAKLTKNTTNGVIRLIPPNTTTGTGVIDCIATDGLTRLKMNLHQSITILADGNVGIGNVNPVHKLQVTPFTHGAISVFGSGDVRYHCYNFGAQAEWLWGQKSSTNHNWTLSKLVSTTETDYLSVSTTGTVTVNNTLRLSKDFSQHPDGVFTIDSSGVVGGRVYCLVNGNFGINKTAPAYKLDVGGDINYSGNLLKNGTNVLQYLDATSSIQEQINTHTHTISQITDRFSLFNNMGNAHTSYQDFNTPDNFGFWFIQGTTNGPATNGATQYYCINQGLGSPYPWAGGGSHGMQIGIPRNVYNPYISIRYKENGSFDAKGWQKMSAGQADKLTTARTINGVSFDGTANITIPSGSSQWITTQSQQNLNTYIQYNGIVSINGGANYACDYNRMAAGSLTIGNLSTNYGLGTTSWSTNTAGLLMECADNTEIAVHDNATRLMSLISYEGGVNRIQIGRKMEASTISTTTIWGNVGIGVLSTGYKLEVNGNVRLLNGFSQHPDGVFAIDKPNIVGGRVICLTNGNFGINKPAPEYALDIGGDINISGSLLRNGVPLYKTYEANSYTMAAYETSYLANATLFNQFTTTGFFSYSMICTTNSDIYACGHMYLTTSKQVKNATSTFQTSLQVSYNDFIFGLTLYNNNSIPLTFRLVFKDLTV